MCINAENIATNVGYLFFPNFWAMGYASEAVSALTTHLVKKGVVELKAFVTHC